MKRNLTGVTASVAIGLAIASFGAPAAPPINLIANGGFETGTFASWTVVNSPDTGGQFVINNGTVDPDGPGGALPPISGNFDALSVQSGPGIRALRQTINVPHHVFSARLSWNDRVRNWAAAFSEPDQEWRVVFRDTQGNLLQEVFSTSPGDELVQVGPNPRYANVTGILQGHMHARHCDVGAAFEHHGGKTLVVSFEEQDSLGFFNATVDDVILLVSVLPVDKDECKKGGWMTFVNVNTGKKIFKNQGDCVSFVATRGKNPPSGYRW